jgi:hypothetical protein
MDEKQLLQSQLLSLAYYSQYVIEPLYEKGFAEKQREIEERNK